MKPGCILLAEDDENDVLFLERAFRQANVANPLQIAPDGQAAIDYLAGTGRYSDRGQFPMPCLAILDLKLPRKTGMEALQWIRSQRDLLALPVIIFSSSVHPEEKALAQQLGANAFLTKPSGTAERIQVARRIKERWLAAA